MWSQLALDIFAMFPGCFRASVSRYGLERPPVAPSGPRPLSLVPTPDDAEIIRKACEGRGSIKAIMGGVHFRISGAEMKPGSRRNGQRAAERTEHRSIGPAPTSR